MPKILRAAETLLRVVFFIGTTLLLIAGIFQAPLPLALCFALASGMLVHLGWKHLRPLFRKNGPAKRLHAEMLSVTAGVALIVLAFAMRSDHRPFGALDAAAIAALAYFIWRIFFVRRHLSRGTLPAERESGIAFAKRTIGQAMDYGSSRRANDEDKKIDR